jgi:hypothetical protein
LSIVLQQEREHYEYIIKEGKVIHKQSGEPLDTRGPKGTKWIFVMSTAKKIYAGQVICLLLLAYNDFATLLKQYYIFVAFRYFTSAKTVSIRHQKQRGVFQHSSFLAGGATIAAGRFTAENGVIKVFFLAATAYCPIGMFVLYRGILFSWYSCLCYSYLWTKCFVCVLCRSLCVILQTIVFCPMGYHE